MPLPAFQGRLRLLFGFLALLGLLLGLPPTLATLSDSDSTHKVLTADKGASSTGGARVVFPSANPVDGLLPGQAQGTDMEFGVRMEVPSAPPTVPPTLEIPRSVAAAASSSSPTAGQPTTADPWQPATAPDDPELAAAAHRWQLAVYRSRAAELEHRVAVFQWQLASGRYIFWTVLGLVLAGLALSVLQLAQAGQVQRMRREAAVDRQLQELLQRARLSQKRVKREEPGAPSGFGTKDGSPHSDHDGVDEADHEEAVVELKHQELERLAAELVARSGLSGNTTEGRTGSSTGSGGGAGDAQAAVSTINISTSGVQVTSPVLGVVILVASFAFFYLYLVHVHPIRELGASAR